MTSDASHMLHALSLGRRGLGRVAPNPAVGCVLVNSGRIVGRGWTQPGGRPHAERMALDQAGSSMISLAMERLGFSARAYDRILKVARTISDLEGSEKIHSAHVAEAINYRNLDREGWSG